MQFGKKVMHELGENVNMFLWEVQQGILLNGMFQQIGNWSVYKLSFDDRILLLFLFNAAILI